MNQFFDRLEKSVEGISSSNIYNYDETNLRDDLGTFCGSATGEFLPPYIVYKVNNCYESWCQGGPEGAIYAATKSGWFDINREKKTRMYS